MEPDIHTLTAIPPALEPLDEIRHAIAAVRAAHLMTQLAARRGPRIEWTIEGTELVGRPLPDASSEEGFAAVAGWAARLGLALAEGAAEGEVEGVAVQLLTNPATPPHEPASTAS